MTWTLAHLYKYRQYTNGLQPTNRAAAGRPKSDAAAASGAQLTTTTAGGNKARPDWPRPAGRRPADCPQLGGLGGGLQERGRPPRGGAGLQG